MMYYTITLLLHIIIDIIIYISSYLRLSCEEEEDRSDWGRDTMLSEPFR